MGTKIVLLAAAVCFLNGVLSSPQGSSEKSCMGANTKQTKARLQAEVDCTRKYPSKVCSRLCILEKLKVIRNNNINNFAWSSYVEASFPSITMTDFLESFPKCSPKYANGTNADSSPDCAENAEFSDCIRDVVETICAKPLPLGK